MLDIDTAIKHCLEVAEENECKMTSDDGYTDVSMKRCAVEHRQLAEWLTELKELREENKVLTSECDRLIKEKGELLQKVSGGDVLRICQLEDRLQAELDNSHCLEIELAEAKRLLKLAVEDFSNMNDHIFDCDGMCDTCPIHGNRDECDKWVRADEALKLLGDE